jgi:hypothetical protein
MGFVRDMLPLKRRRSSEISSAVGAQSDARRSGRRRDTPSAVRDDDEDDEEYNALSEGEAGDGERMDSVEMLRVSARTDASVPAFKCNFGVCCALGARLPWDVFWSAPAGPCCCSGSDLEDSLDDCLPVPSDELLDLVDEQSASESEVRPLYCTPAVLI